MSELVKKEVEVVEKDLVVIDASEYGLDENRAKTVKAAFVPMLHTMEELEVEYNKIVNQYKKDGYTEEIGKAARELRLKYVKVRTGTKEIHKKQKAYYRNGGLFVDAWKNTQKSISDGIESELSEIENYWDILTKKIEEENRVERFEKLKTLDPEYIEPIGLGTWEDSTFDSFFSGEELRIENEAKEAKRLQEEEEEKQRVADLQTKRLTQCSRIAYLIEDFQNKNFGKMSNEEYESLVTAALNKERLQVEEEAYLYNIAFDDEKVLTDKADTFVAKLLKDGYEKRRSGDYIKSGNTISYESLKTLNQREFKDLIKKNNDSIKSARLIIETEAYAENDRINEAAAKLRLEIDLLMVQAIEDNKQFDIDQENKKLAASSDNTKLDKFVEDTEAYLNKYIIELQSEKAQHVFNHSISMINEALSDILELSSKM